MVGRPREFEIDDVLERAMAYFWARGYGGADMRGLIEHVGIGRQSLYNAFGDKRTLFLRALEHYGRTRVTAAVAELAGPGSPLARLRRAVRSWARPREGGHGGCLHCNSMAELGCDDEQATGILRRWTRAFDDAYADVVREAVAAGELPVDTDAADLGAALGNAARGVALLARIDDRESIRRVVRETERRLGG